MMRWLLFAAALLLGGWLGSLLLSGASLLGQLAFLAVCGALGWAFYQIDRRTRR